MFDYFFTRYVRNPGFPDEFDDLDDCSYNVRKISEGHFFSLKFYFFNFFT